MKDLLSVIVCRAFVLDDDGVGANVDRCLEIRQCRLSPCHHRRAITLSPGQ